MIRLFSATLLSLLLCASLANAAEKPLIVASDATWPPIEMLDENKNVVGYSIDYLKAVAKEAGLNVEFRNTAWDGIFAALESRQADIIASSVTITDKRKKAMGFSDPYCEIRQAVVVSTNSDLKNLKELDGKKVGGQIGTTGLVETLPKAKSKAIVKTYDEVGLALEDHCKAIDMVIQHGRNGEIYNVGGHNEKQNIEIVKLTIATIHRLMTEEPAYRSVLKKKEIGSDGQINIDWINDSLITFVKDRLGHDQRYAIDPTKIKNELGWYPETKFEDGIVKTIRWYLDNQEWVKNVTSGDYQNYYENMYKNR